MTDLRKSYERSLARSRLALTRPDRPAVFRLAGRDWALMDGVFAPPFTATTETALRILRLPAGDAPAFRRGGSFLEIGSGTGVIAVCAALAGCSPVVATDINPQAVANTRANAARHGVAGIVRAVPGDLFDAVGPAERFDTVYWHSNFVLAPGDYAYHDAHERAYVDPGYRAHERYLIEAPTRVTPGGVALLQFSDRGDVDLLHRMAAAHGREVRAVRRERFAEGAEVIEHILFEIRIAD